MRKKLYKEIGFYIILTFLIFYAVKSDQKAWQDKELDLRNTIGPSPHISSKVDSFVITDQEGTGMKSESFDLGYNMVILWSIEDSGGTDLFFDTLDKALLEGAYSEMNILPINIGDKKEDIDDFFQKNDYSFRWYMDSGKTVKWAFNRSFTSPIVYLLDDQGIVRLRQEVGRKSYNDNLFSRLKKFN